MAFEEKIEKYSTLGSTTKIRERRENFLFLTDGSRYSEKSQRESR